MIMGQARILYQGEELSVAVDANATPLIADQPVHENDFVWLPPVYHSVICVALNDKNLYAQRQAEFTQPPYNTPPKEPFFFIKPANTITANNAMVQFPDRAEAMLSGGGLAVVMGKTGFKIAKTAALDYIKGYSIFNDFSLPEKSFFRPAVSSQCFDSFGPLGPALMNKESIPDPDNVVIKTLINGVRKQTGQASDMIRSTADLITALSSFMTLREDDIIVTGFPHQRAEIKVGDEVTIEIDGIGKLTNYIVTEAEFYAAESSS